MRTDIVVTMANCLQKTMCSAMAAHDHQSSDMTIERAALTPSKPRLESASRVRSALYATVLSTDTIRVPSTQRVTAQLMAVNPSAPLAAPRPHGPSIPSSPVVCHEADASGCPESGSGAECHDPALSLLAWGCREFGGGAVGMRSWHAGVIGRDEVRDR